MRLFDRFFGNANSVSRLAGQLFGRSETGRLGKRGKQSKGAKSLQMESLEDRQLLAVTGWDDGVSLANLPLAADGSAYAAAVPAPTSLTTPSNVAVTTINAWSNPNSVYYRPNTSVYASDGRYTGLAEVITTSTDYDRTNYGFLTADEQAASQSATNQQFKSRGTTYQQYHWMQTAAEMLWVAGWARNAGFTSIDELQEHIQKNFTQVKNGYANDVIEWFLTGDFNNVNDRYYQHNGVWTVKTNANGGGFFQEVDYASVASYSYGDQVNLSNLRDGNRPYATGQTGTDMFNQIYLALDANTAVSVELSWYVVNTAKSWIRFPVTSNGTGGVGWAMSNHGDTNSLVIDGLLFNSSAYASATDNDHVLGVRFASSDAGMGIEAGIFYLVEWDSSVGAYRFAIEPTWTTSTVESNAGYNTRIADAAWNTLRNGDDRFRAWSNQGGNLWLLNNSTATGGGNIRYFTGYTGGAAKYHIAGSFGTGTTYEVTSTGAEARAFQCLAFTGINFLVNYYEKITPTSLVDPNNLRNEADRNSVKNLNSLYNPDGTAYTAKVIYLDSSNFRVDFNANYLSFQEKLWIQEIWQRVAEDYAPFEVNVTLDPAVAARAGQLWTVDIWTNFAGGYQSDHTNNSAGMYKPVGAGNTLGGVANGAVGAAYGPSMFYYVAMGMEAALSTTLMKVVAEYCSSYVAIRLGVTQSLYIHSEGGGGQQTTVYGGRGEWGPIMGYGASVARQLTQWSMGEYYGAVNPQNQIQVLATRLGMRVDDHGKTMQTATLLKAVNYTSSYSSRQATIEVKGIIGVSELAHTTRDKDYFKFESYGGSYVIDVAGVGTDYRWLDRNGSGNQYDWWMTNLNIQLDIYDSLGNLIQTISSTGTSFAHVNISLPAKKDKDGNDVLDDDGNIVPEFYYFCVSGVGEGNAAQDGYSSYGSLGQYTMTVREDYANLVQYDATTGESYIVVTTLDDIVRVDNQVTLREALYLIGRRLDRSINVGGTNVYDQYILNEIRFDYSLIFNEELGREYTSEELLSGVARLRLDPTLGELVINYQLKSGESLSVLAGDGSIATVINAQQFWVTDTADINGGYYKQVNGATITIDPRYDVAGGLVSSNRVIYVDHIEAELHGLIITGGNAQAHLNSQSNAAAMDNINQYGGGVFNHYGWLTISDSYIAGNSALKAGGGIYNTGGYGPMHYPIGTGNEYDYNDFFGYLQVIDTAIIGNITTYDKDRFSGSTGGGIFNDFVAQAILVNCTIAGNVSAWSGGGINNYGRMTVQNSLIAQNFSTHGSDVFTHLDAFNRNGYTNVAYSFIGDTTFANDNDNGSVGVPFAAGAKYGKPVNNQGNNVFGNSGVTNADGTRNFTNVRDPYFLVFSSTWVDWSTKYNVPGYQKFNVIDISGTLNPDGSVLNEGTYSHWNEDLWKSWNLSLLSSSAAVDTGLNTHYQNLINANLKPMLMVQWDTDTPPDWYLAVTGVAKPSNPYSLRTYYTIRYNTWTFDNFINETVGKIQRNDADTLYYINLVYGQNLSIDEYNLMRDELMSYPAFLHATVLKTGLAQMGIDDVWFQAAKPTIVSDRCTYQRDIEVDIRAGNIAGAYTDLAGLTRIVNTRIDMGAYEYQRGAPDFTGFRPQTINTSQVLENWKYSLLVSKSSGDRTGIGINVDENTYNNLADVTADLDQNTIIFDENVYLSMSFLNQGGFSAGGLVIDLDLAITQTGSLNYHSGYSGGVFDPALYNHAYNSDVQYKNLLQFTIVNNYPGATARISVSSAVNWVGGLSIQGGSVAFPTGMQEYVVTNLVNSLGDVQGTIWLYRNGMVMVQDLFFNVNEQTAVGGRGLYQFTMNMNPTHGSNEQRFDNNVYSSVIQVIETPCLIVDTTDDIIDRYDGKTSLREALAYASYEKRAEQVLAEGTRITVGSAIYEVRSGRFYQVTTGDFHFSNTTSSPLTNGVAFTPGTQATIRESVVALYRQYDANGNFLGTTKVVLPAGSILNYTVAGDGTTDAYFKLSTSSSPTTGNYQLVNLTALTVQGTSVVYNSTNLVLATLSVGTVIDEAYNQQRAIYNGTIFQTLQIGSFRVSGGVATSLMNGQKIIVDVSAASGTGVNQIRTGMLSIPVVGGSAAMELIFENGSFYALDALSNKVWYSLDEGKSFIFDPDGLTYTWSAAFQSTFPIMLDSYTLITQGGTAYTWDGAEWVDVNGNILVPTLNQTFTLKETLVKTDQNVSVTFKSGSTIFVTDLWGNVITFDSVVFANEETITLDAIQYGTLVIDKTITIDAGTRFNRATGEYEVSAVKVAIDGDNQVQVFHVNANIQVQMNNLIIQYGFSAEKGDYLGLGGGIQVEKDATLRLDDCVIQGNVAEIAGGGIYALGQLQMTNTIVASNKVKNYVEDLDANRSFYGGGIYYNNPGTPLTLVDILLVGNTIEIYVDGNTSNVKVNGYGGGLYTHGELTLTDTLVMDNTIIFYKGTYTSYVEVVSTDSIVPNGYGGGVYADNVTAQSTDSTNPMTAFIGNTAKFGYGGAVYATGTIKFTDVVTIADNMAGKDGGALYAFGDVTLSAPGTLTDPLALSLINNSAGYSGGAIFSRSNVMIDDLLTISDNSAGQQSLGHGGAIYAVGNVSIMGKEDFGPIVVSDNGTNEGNGGFVRAGGNLVISGIDVFVGNYAGIVSRAGYTQSSGGTAWAGGNIVISGFELIDASSAGGRGGAFFANGNVTLTGADDAFDTVISNITAQNGSGGFVWAGGNVTITEVEKFDTIRAGNLGMANGGLVFSNGNVSITGVHEILDVTAGGSGGVVYALGNVLLSGLADGQNTVNGLTITNARAMNGAGGVVYAGSIAGVAGTVTLDRVLDIAGSRAVTDGGVVYADGDVVITGTYRTSIIANNQAGGSGGVVYTHGNVTFNRIETIANSSAGRDGGVFYAEGTIDLNDVELIINSSAGRDGGVIYAMGDVTLTGIGEILYASAGRDGGVVFSRGDVEISGGTYIADVDARSGGVVYAQGNVYLDGIEIIGAKADDKGGAVYADGNVSIENATSITDGSATYGGAVYAGGNLIALGTNNADTFLARNQAGILRNGTLVTGSAAGGALYVLGTVYLANVTLTGNLAFGDASSNSGLGGAIYSESLVTLDNRVTLSGNIAGTDGGAIYIGGINANAGVMVRGIGVSITGNYAGFTADGSGGGVCLANGDFVAIRSFAFTYNTAFGGDGGALYSNGDVYIADSAIFGNTAIHGSGGAFFMADPDGEIRLVNSAVFGNSAYGDGGAFASAGTIVLVNTTVAGNSAQTGNGGALYSTGTLVLLNSIVAQNKASTGKATDIYFDGADGNSIYVQNSLIGAGILGLSGQVTPGYRTASFLGTETTPINPLFKTTPLWTGTVLSNLTALMNGGLALTELSLAVDAGSNALARYTKPGDSPILIDLLGYGRIFNNIVDMGAYELQVAASCDLTFDTASVTVKPVRVGHLDANGLFEEMYLTEEIEDVYLEVTFTNISDIGSWKGDFDYTIEAYRWDWRTQDWELTPFRITTETYSFDADPLRYPVSYLRTGDTATFLVNVGMMDVGTYYFVVTLNTIDPNTGERKVTELDYDNNKYGSSSTTAHETKTSGYIVINTSDDYPIILDDGIVSLREALYLINTDNYVRSYVTIYFGVDHITGERVSNITLTAGQLDVLNSVKIDATLVGWDNAGNEIHDNTLTLTINGVGASRIFKVAEYNYDGYTSTPRIGLHAEFVNLILTNGNAVANLSASDRSDLTKAGGGAIDTAAINGLVLTNCEIYGNIASYGGAIRNTGKLDIYNSLIYGNTTAYTNGVYSQEGFDGGAIYNGGARLNSDPHTGVTIVGGQLTIYNSKINGNYAGAYGGGIANYGIAELYNTEIAGNRATHGGGILISGTFQPMLIVNCTIAGNIATAYGGGIWTNTSMSIYNSIIWGNKATSGDANIYKTGGSTVVTEGNNLKVDPRFITFTTPTAFSKDAWKSWNLQLSALSTNAIDQGNNARVSGFADLVGNRRINNALVDIGAYEYYASTIIPSTTVYNATSTTVAVGTKIANITLAVANPDPDGYIFEILSDSNQPIDPALYFVVNEFGELVTIRAINLVNNLSLTITIRATDSTGKVYATCPIIFALNKPPVPAPALLATQQVAATEVFLTWAANSEATGFRVRYKTLDATSWTVYDKAFSGTSGYVRANFVCGETYIFQVQAIGNGEYNDSQWSDAQYGAGAGALPAMLPGAIASLGWQQQQTVTMEYLAPNIDVSLASFADGSVVQFTAQLNSALSATITGWEIDWGDNSSTRVNTRTTALSVVHYYALEATFTITLRLFDAQGFGNDYVYTIGTHTRGSAIAEAPLAAPMSAALPVAAALPESVTVSTETQAAASSMMVESGDRSDDFIVTIPATERVSLIALKKTDRGTASPLSGYSSWQPSWLNASAIFGINSAFRRNSRASDALFAQEKDVMSDTEFGFESALDANHQIDSLYDEILAEIVLD